VTPLVANLDTATAIMNAQHIEKGTSDTSSFRILCTMVAVELT
jgi:hypothetical protein